MRLFCVLWIWVFLSELKTSSTMEIHGHVGKNISILCSHQWASNNRKYFCRDPCEETDILVKSGQSPNGRFTLENCGNEFTVSITDLRLSDGGIYKCGVDRVGLDTYIDVKLSVTEDPLEKVTHPRTTETQTTPRINAEIHTTSHKHSTVRALTITENTQTSTGFANASHPAADETALVHYILYTGVGLAVVLIICAVGLIAVCQHRKRVKKSRRSVARSIYNEHPSEAGGGVYENRPEDRLYASMNKHRHRSEDGPSEPIYQNLNTTHGEAIYGNLY